MKYIIFLLLLKLSFLSFAQTTATTPDGKKVFLNTNGTWKFANANQKSKDCEDYHTGNVKVTNNTNATIYFYYAKEGETPTIVVVRSKSSKLIKGFVAYPVGLSTVMNTYKWVVSLGMESVDFLSEMTGIQKGQFDPTECQTKEIEIK